jgi:DNA-directed RNA polymerase subunit RPC12/RpoP
MKKTSTMYVIDLTKIEGDGDFPCPYCGVMISPEDERDNTYIIQEVKMKANEDLEKLVIKCNSCGSVIHIVGFDS